MSVPHSSSPGNRAIRGATRPAFTFAQALAARAERQPAGEVIRIVGREPWSAALLWQVAASWARSLDGAIGQGDVVITAADTGPEAVALTAAVSALGGVELPLALDVPTEWARYLSQTTRAVAVLSVAERAARQPLLTTLATTNGIPLVLVDVDLDVDHPGATTVVPRALSRTEPALIMTTSGTTGRTKAALLPVGAPARQAARVADAMGYGPADVVLSLFPWHHINARHACFFPALLSGSRVVVAPRFSASRFLDTVRGEAVTAFNFMGALCSMLLAQPATRHDRDHSLRTAYGGPAPAALLEAFRDRFGVTLRQAYACTELGDVAITPQTELVPGAAGRVLEDYDVEIVDEHGDPVPDGEVGEVVVRPRTDGDAFLGYVGDSRATADAWRDGWFRTLDRARMVDGWLTIEGRLGDVIRRRGVNIDPHRVEDALLAHPDVVEAVAVAVPSELTEDEVLAVVVLTADAEVQPELLWDHCRSRLPRHTVPRYLSIEREHPLRDNLKVDRAALRRRGVPPTAWDAADSHAITPERR